MTVHKPWVIADDLEDGDTIECLEGHFFAKVKDAGSKELGTWPVLVSEDGEPLTWFIGMNPPIRCKKCGSVAMSWTPVSRYDEGKK